MAYGRSNSISIGNETNPPSGMYNSRSAERKRPAGSFFCTTHLNSYSVKTQRLNHEYNYLVRKISRCIMLSIVKGHYLYVRNDYYGP
jgi:hypothetical protein